jgi:hypothetical protein
MRARAYVCVCVHMVCVGVCRTNSVCVHMECVGVCAYAHIFSLFFVKGHAWTWVFMGIGTDIQHTCFFFFERD